MSENQANEEQVFKSAGCIRFPEQDQPADACEDENPAMGILCRCDGRCVPPMGHLLSVVKLMIKPLCSSPPTESELRGSGEDADEVDEENGDWSYNQNLSVFVKDPAVLPNNNTLYALGLFENQATGGIVPGSMGDVSFIGRKVESCE